MYLHALLLDYTTTEDVAVVVASAHALGQLLPDVIRGRVAMPVDQVQDFTFVQTVFGVCHRCTEQQFGPLHLAAHARFVALLAPHVRTGRDAHLVNAAHDARDPDDFRGERGRWDGALAPACYPAGSCASRRNT